MEMLTECVWFYVCDYVVQDFSAYFARVSIILFLYLKSQVTMW